MIFSEKTQVLLIGCGKMGSALLKGWTQGAADFSITVVEPGDVPAAAADLPEVRWLQDVAQLSADLSPEIIVSAIKPQVTALVAPQYAPLVKRGAHFLSIAAGQTIGSYEAMFGSAAAITRAMPNTPAAIGRGVAVCCCNAFVTGQQRRLAERLLLAVGTVSWVADERLIDAVTAVSGSGPAYIFLLVETLAAAGIDAGLPAELAWKIARETVSGTGALLDESADSPEQLRKNVTSPGGTTQAALDVLMAPDGLQNLIGRAVQAAARRSRELAS